MTELIVREQSDASQIAARAIADLIIQKPTAVLGLATGSTPLKVYEELAKLVKDERIDVSQIQGFALDEYVGIEKTHPESYYSIINKHVTIPLGLNPELVHTPNGDLSTIETAGIEYDAAIKAAGGVDLQILGIGTDGHIGFNEPGSSLVSRTRIKTLTAQTREDNARFFASIDEVPKHCITQGIGTILEARHLLLLAFGENKAEAVAQSLEGGISSFWPASALQLHAHVSVFVDNSAAKLLKNRAYYEFAYDNKPDWQGL
jgi:glucosamine-6-phosphate deaminase